MRRANYCHICGARLGERHSGGRVRPYCGACEQPIYFDPKVAVVVFIERGDAVLLVKRGMEPALGKWALPAGFVDHDEAPEAAAIRETLEETGLSARIVELLAVYPKRDDGLADIVIAYRAEVVGGVAEAGDDAVDLGWFRRDDLPPLAFYPTRTLLGLWRDGKL